MMEDLCDHLLLEIVLRLPLKLAIQFKCMNNRFNNLISDPQFAAEHALRSTQDASSFISSCYNSFEFFYNFPLHPQHAVVQSPPTFVILPLDVSIMASCNGLLLLYIRCSGGQDNFFCVSNPITSTYQLIPLPENEPPRYRGPPGLVVDFPRALSSPHYKLVYIYDKMHRSASLMGLQSEYGFKIFASDSNSWRDSEAKLSCSSSLFLTCDQTISLNGSLHWVRRCRDIVVFDTNKEQARTIKPPGGLELCNYHTKLGVADGLINLIVTTAEEIVVWILHDYENGEWRVGTRINITTIESDYKNGIFFNGRLFFWLGNGRLFLQQQLIRGVWEVYVYNMRFNVWKKIATVPCETNSITTFPFFPTLAKVSAINHLHGNLAEHGILEKIKESIRLLTLLLTSSPESSSLFP